MIPRARLDIGLRDMLYAATGCAVPGDAAMVRAQIESAWPDGGAHVACLSVRTGFDLVLTALKLPPGSEVLLSAVTIADMARIVRAHGLVPVPVDIDPATLAPDIAALERALSSRSRVLVLAHLFGAWSRFDDAIEFARTRGLLVIEDIAQSAAARRFAGNTQSDVRMFSFGAIKTETALGGAIIVFRSDELADAVRRIESGYPEYGRARYAARITRFAALRAIATRPGMTLFVNACALTGRSYDDVIAQNMKGFPGAGFLAQIRRRASRPMLALLGRRLGHPSTARLRRRCTTARAFIAMLDPCVQRPGTAVRRHTYWLFPILVDDPEGVAAALREDGFDATRGATSLTVVAAPAERPDNVPARAHALIARVLFLPVYPEADYGTLQRLAGLVNSRCDGRPSH